ncbi:hypothetical protein ACO2RV_18640 [Ancylobacter sp. VNQ12]|uniref:hypothetical protein n=1 Tax=Ancylobacter sp. VNQ12 TaxID=3400920 RepID=UPI003C0A4288
MILKKRQTAPEPFRVRSLAEADPNYAAILEKQGELRSVRSRLDAEESEILFRLANDKPSDAPVNHRVAALLGDDVDEADPAADGLRARFTACQSERRDVDAALRVVDERLRAARGTASKLITADVEPEYRARVAALGAALAAAYDAHVSVEEIPAAMQRADVAFAPVFTEGRATRIFGQPRDKNGRVAAWFREAVKAGLVDTVPEAFR